jgi:hypothetical protein
LKPHDVPWQRRTHHHHLCYPHPSVCGINNLVYPCNTPATLRKALS